MTDQRPEQSDPHVLDQPWRIWSTIAVMGIVLVGILLGVIVIPVVQGRSAGIDAFTAIVGGVVTRVQFDQRPGQTGEFVLQTDRGEIWVSWQAGRVTVLEVLHG